MVSNQKYEMAEGSVNYPIYFPNPHTPKSPTTLYIPVEGVWPPAGVGAIKLLKTSKTSKTLKPLKLS